MSAADSTRPPLAVGDESARSATSDPLVSLASSSSLLSTPKGPPGASGTPNPTPGDSIATPVGGTPRRALPPKVSAVVSDSEDEEDVQHPPEPPHITEVRTLVTRLLACKTANKAIAAIKEREIKLILTHVREIFMSENMLLELQPPLRICGDVHGQFHDLLRIFDRCHAPPESNYLFLGDYVDRGRHSVETIVLLYGLKILYPKAVHLLRGNHECASINKMYGFYDDVKRRYNVRLFKTFADVFNCMPVACSINEKILCMHGGLSPELDKLENINKIKRPVDVPEAGLLCDLLWADPEPDIDGFVESDRGVSYLFGEDVVTDFLDLHGYDLVVRAHQVVEKGYAFFSERQLVTVFSAPNYCGEFDNAAAVLSIDPEMRCSFIVIS